MAEFTDKELTLLAGFVCERYDTLLEIAEDPRITNPSFKAGARKDAHSIESLNAKLRPHYRKGQ